MSDTILVMRSVTILIQVKLLNLGRSVIKSIKIDHQGRLGISSGFEETVFLVMKMKKMKKTLTKKTFDKIVNEFEIFLWSQKRQKCCFIKRELSCS